MKLYCPTDPLKLPQVQLAARLWNHPVTHVDTPFPHKHKPLSDAFPLFTLPALEIESPKDGEPRFIFGCHSILLHISRANQAEIQKSHLAATWAVLQICQRELQPAVGLLLSPEGASEQQVQKAKDIIQRFSKFFDVKLKQNSFLIGTKIDISDIAVFYALKVSQQLKLNIQKGNHALTRWMNYMTSLSQ